MLHVLPRSAPFVCIAKSNMRLGLVVIIFLSVGCLEVCAQAALEERSPAEWLAAMQAAPLDTRRELQTLLQDQENPGSHWALLLTEAYRYAAAPHAATWAQADTYMSYQDSALTHLGYALQHFSRKTHRRYASYYEKFLPATALGSSDEIRAYLVAQQQVLQQKILKIKQLDSLFSRATARYAHIQNRYEGLQKQQGKPVHLAVLSEASFQETVRPLADEFLAARADFETFLAEATSSLYPTASIAEANEPTAEILDKNTLYLFDFEKWCAAKEKVRHKAMPLYRQASKLLDELAAHVAAAEADTLLTLDNGPALPTLAEFEAQWAFTDLSFLPDWLNYQRARAQFARSLNSEKLFFNYKYQPKEVIAYYYRLQAQAVALERQLHTLTTQLEQEAIWAYMAQLLTPSYDDQTHFRAHLQKELNYIHARQAYCELRIRDQLLYENIALKHLPRYVRHGSYVLPLFEQPSSLVVQEGDYVTTHLLKEANDTYYLTGYQKKQGKQGFVARVVGEQVVWIKMAEKQFDAARKPYDSQGVALASNQEGGCLAILQYGLAEDARKLWLSLDSNGVAQDTFSFETTHDVRKIMTLKQQDQRVYLAASLGKISSSEATTTVKWSKRNASDASSMPAASERFAQDAEEEDVHAVVVTQFDGSGQVAWKFRLPFQGELTDVVEFADRYVLVCNQPGHDADEQVHVRLIALSKQGTFLAQRTLEAKRAYFATRTLKLDTDRVLVVGFEGECDINQLEQREVIHLLINEQLELLESNLE